MKVCKNNRGAMDSAERQKLDLELCEAVKTGDVARAERLLQLGARDNCQKYLFHLATQTKHFEITKLLMAYSQDMSANFGIEEQRNG